MKIKQSNTLESLIVRGVELFRRAQGGEVVDAIFLATLLNEQCHATHLLRRELKEWELYQLRVRLENSLMRYPRPANPTEADLTSTLEKLYEGMTHICHTTLTQRKEESLNTGHLLLYVMRNRALLSARIVSDYGLDIEAVEEAVRNLPSGEDYYSDMHALQGEMRPIHITSTTSRRESNEVLEQFGTDLTAAARRGDLDPVVGRAREVERVIQVLGRRRKNNPILVGEAGVGKSAIVEGLALRIVAGDVPSALIGKRVFSLDVSLLVAGTKYRGEFEERVSKLLQYVTDNQDIILFIDEIHNIVGAGSSQGSLDAANIIKPALARGVVQCVGATTLDEYRQHIERDAALDRRFQRVIVEPTSPADTLDILRNLRPRYEEHHAVRYTDEALEACVRLAERYITERHLPDKAIDLLDEAGAMVALSASAEVGEEEVRQVVARATGIPAESLSQRERERLAGLAARLAERVVGQPRAVEQLARAVVRSRAGLADGGRPSGVFLFVGPTGVGKTLLAKELAEALFGRPDALLRFDMSEYAERHNMSRMIGSPPGYVGYGEGGRLTEAVRRHPYSVVLLDEIEKAHPEVCNLMLQLFDEGHLTDGVGRRVDFCNTVIIMTSNLGSHSADEPRRPIGYRRADSEEREQGLLQSHYRRAVEEHFSPEFINRLDDVVCFDRLGVEEVAQIVDLELEKLFARLAELGVECEVTGGARHLLATEGYNSRYGARALRRVISERVETAVAQMIVEGRIAAGSRVVVDAADEICVKIIVKQSA